MSRGSTRGGMRRSARWAILGLALCCWPVISALADVGRDHAVSNIAALRAVAVGARHHRPAELRVTAASVTLRTGNVLAGSAAVRNVGAHRAQASTAALAWSSRDGGGMVQIHRFQVPALAPGHLHKANFNVTVPKTASGTYDVSVCADVLGQVAKFSAKHECRKAGTVTVGQPSSGVKGHGPTGSEPPAPSPPPSGSSPPPGPGPAPASSPPDTALDSGPSATVGQSSATLTFHGSDTNDTFQCSLDGAPWATCTSPQQYTSLADGTHTFRVRAVNSAGEADPTPAEASWTVDTTPPAATLTNPANGGWTNNVTPVFSGAAGTASGDSSTITVYLYAGSCRRRAARSRP